MDNIRRIHEIRAIHWKLGVSLEKAKCIFYTNYNDPKIRVDFMPWVNHLYDEYMAKTNGKVAIE